MPHHSEAKVVPFGQSIETTFEVIVETFDMSDYSEDFRTSFFNFSKKSYSHNNCNTRERFKVLKLKDDILEDLLANSSLYDKKDVDLRMKQYLLLDLELTILRNLDLLEPIPKNIDGYESQKIQFVKNMQKDFFEQFKKQGSIQPNLEIQEETLKIIKKYEENFSIQKPDGTREGNYESCGGTFSQIYDGWRDTFKKFSRSNSESTANFSKELDELIKTVKNFPDDFAKHMSKIFKEEVGFFDKLGEAYDKDTGFLKTLSNVSSYTMSKLSPDLVKVYKHFENQFSSKKESTTAKAPKEFRDLVQKNLGNDPTQKALENAITSGLDLSDIALKVDENTQTHLKSIDLQTKVKKIQYLTDIHSSAVLSLQLKSFTAVQKCNQLNFEVKSLDSKWKKVYDSQCK